jgi:hypothetical protein
MIQPKTSHWQGTGITLIGLPTEPTLKHSGFQKRIDNEKNPKKQKNQTLKNRTAFS